MTNATKRGHNILSTQAVLESDLVAVFQEMCARFKIDQPDSLDVSLLDACAFKSGNPGKWPTWIDLDIHSSKRGNPANRGEAIKAVHDVCSKLESLLDNSEGHKPIGSEAIGAYRTKVISLRKKVTLLEDALLPINPELLLAALEGADTKLMAIDSMNPEVSILDAFAFCPGKPGLFATWADLDIASCKAGDPSKRGSVVAALRDLLVKCDQLLSRPACQRALGSTTLEKYRSMTLVVGEKLTLLEDALSPPNLQPLLLMLEEMSRRFEHVSVKTCDVRLLDTCAFRPGRPGLFTVWTDLDVSTDVVGSPNNRGAVIMALDDLMAKSERILARPSSQLALGADTIQKYCLMRASIGALLALLKNAVVPSTPNAPKTFMPSPVKQSLLCCSPQHSSVQEKIKSIKKKIGKQPPIVYPTLFSQEACIEAGAMAGTSMVAAMLIAILFRSIVKLVPVVGLVAIVLSLVRRQNFIANDTKRRAAAETQYKNAITDNDILNIFPLLARHVQAQFLVNLDSEFRRSVARRYTSLTAMCAYIDAYLSASPESPDRTIVETNLRMGRFGKEVARVLSEK